MWVNTPPQIGDSASAVIEDDTNGEARRLMAGLRVVRDVTKAEARKRGGR